MTSTALSASAVSSFLISVARHLAGGIMPHETHTPKGVAESHAIGLADGEAVVTHAEYLLKTLTTAELD